MVEALTRLLGSLHAAGYVHRDVKPENVVVLMQSMKWRMLDLGICARIGARLRASCTLKLCRCKLHVQCSGLYVSVAWQHADCLRDSPDLSSLQSNLTFSMCSGAHPTFVRGAGEVKWPRCTLAYAPPEIITAAKADRDVRVAAAQDLWALGVIAYEAVVGAVTFTSVSAIGECASGVAQYPWERPLEAQPSSWRRSKLRSLVAPLMSREPDARPPAAALLEALSRMGHATTLR